MIDEPLVITPLSDVPPGFSIAATVELNPFAIRRPCRSEGDEILVCGRRDESPYRARPLPMAPLDPVRETEIPFGIDAESGTRIGPTINQVEFPGGFISQRVMMTLRTRF